MSDLEIRSESELQSVSWSTTTVHDEVFEKDNTENEVQGDKVEENESAIEEKNYDEYDRDYQEYMPRYATYSKKSESVSQKFLKKKIVVILVVLVVCTVGVAVGLSVHFTQPPTTTMATTTTVSKITTVKPIETTSAKGILFQTKPIKLNEHSSYVIHSRIHYAAYT